MGKRRRRWKKKSSKSLVDTQRGKEKRGVCACVCVCRGRGQNNKIEDLVKKGRAGIGGSRAGMWFFWFFGGIF
jgi:hypothetical protein